MLEKRDTNEYEIDGSVWDWSYDRVPPLLQSSESRGDHPRPAHYDRKEEMLHRQGLSGPSVEGVEEKEVVRRPDVSTSEWLT